MFATVVTEFEYQKLKSAHNALQQKVDKMEEKFLMKIWEKEKEIYQLKATNVEFHRRMDEAFEKITKFSEMLEVRMMTYEPEEIMANNNDQFMAAEIDENAHRTPNLIMQQQTMEDHNLRFVNMLSKCANVEGEQMGKVEEQEVEEEQLQQQQQQQQQSMNGQLCGAEKEVNGEENGAQEEGAAVKYRGQLKKDHTSGKRQVFYKCAHCPETFRWQSVLIRHERIHTGERPFECDKCGKEFSRVSTLNIHQRIHSGEKPCECHFCGVRFTQDSQLKTHIRIHTGERPYKCTYCGHKFARAGNLKTHLRLHTGEKPFMCSHCGKQFTQSSQLQIHLHVHYRKHKCEICQKSFAKDFQLKNHIINTHQQNVIMC